MSPIRRSVEADKAVCGGIHLLCGKPARTLKIPEEVVKEEVEILGDGCHRQRVSCLAAGRDQCGLGNSQSIILARIVLQPVRRTQRPTLVSPAFDHGIQF